MSSSAQRYTNLPEFPDLTCTISPCLRRLLDIYTAARRAIETLTDCTHNDLSTYYNHVHVWHRKVITGVPELHWYTDLCASLTAALFAREQLAQLRHSDHNPPSNNMNYDLDVEFFQSLLTRVVTDIRSKWFQYIITNARFPKMVGMPPFPGLELAENRFYVCAVSQTWPSKRISNVNTYRNRIATEIDDSERVHAILHVNAHASRLFVNGETAGDLGGLQLELSSHELEFLNVVDNSTEQHLSVGWVTQYKDEEKTTTVIELDPTTNIEYHMDADCRRRAYDFVKVREQRLDMYFRPDMHSLNGLKFRDNFVLSRLLVYAHYGSDEKSKSDGNTNSIIHVDIMKYICVHGTEQQQNGLGAIDEEVLLRSLGSMSAMNKIYAALALSAKSRLLNIIEHGTQLRDPDRVIRAILPTNFPDKRILRAGIDGVHVRTGVPWDSIFVGFFSTVILSISTSFPFCRHDMCQEPSSFWYFPTWALALAVLVPWIFHHVRYKGWPLYDMARLARLCKSDSDLRIHMTEPEAVYVMAEAGACGMPMDGILSCAFSSSSHGTFSLSKPLQIDVAQTAGMKLCVDVQLRPVWVDRKGVRRAQVKRTHAGAELWHAHGAYINVSFLDMSYTGPRTVGSKGDTSMSEK